MVFVELPKFKQKLEELKTITDKWIYFIKEAPNLEIIPDKMENINEIKEALNIANIANLSVKELDELHHIEVFAQDQRGLMIQAKEEGRKEGQIDLILHILKQKLGEISPDLITSIENLSSEKLAELSVAIFDFKTVDEVSNFLS
jgi:predicted transposase/invertase (TIGR01784 family)